MKSLASLLSFLLLSACDGFREAMTAHVDVAARAESQELSVERLAQLIGNTDIPQTQDLAKGVAGIWVNYQLLAHAAAKVDSLRDTALVDDALWPVIAEARVNKWHDQLMKNMPKFDSSANAARYAQGEMLAARHILFLTPDQMTPAGRDSVRRKAESVRANVTSANFARMVSRHSEEPGAKDRGGNLGVFARGNMVPEFEQGVLALKPGEVSPLVQTQFGYHIIRRSTYDEVKNEFAQAMTGRSQTVADSTYIAQLEARGKIKLRNNAAAIAKQVAKNLDESRDDNTTIATTNAGDFTAAKLARWITAYPQRGQILQILQTAPDSIVLQFVKNMIRNELVLGEATKAKVKLDPKDMTRVREGFGRMVIGTWSQLGVAPEQLADSAQPEVERERVAAARIESYLDRLLANKTQFVPVPPELESLVKRKYDWKLNTAGVERALERAQKIRAARDSTRNAARPQTQVPMAPEQPATQGEPARQQPTPLP